ncbi:alpha/beta fold hydrolase [Kineosporia succinea]|uniref:Pimeloyl-ACP methyl ester carboxylesterase n=1 Tax=Kineosporia succinea TaxID=84632 RepID=A0ABT9PER3_9ACTN|nr:alpha/beta hydrolase [Kineosporia succinea]MDP9830972.1 pimeloyl-ACP methyl ester carboxylesterase [Kineosporia succinea]
MSTATVRNVVLVHGAFVDGSGWRDVHDQLVAEGFAVHIVQNPTESLDGDVAATQYVLDRLDGPAVLVGHSYGGVVITVAGHHEKVASLVYVAAFAPDKAESVAALIGTPPADSPIQGPDEGYLSIDKARFPAAFGADLPAEQARFLANSQVPWGVAALTGTVTDPAWRVKPSWYLVASDDQTIPPDAQRGMAARAGATTSEVAASHAAYISRPGHVVELVRAAAGA